MKRLTEIVDFLELNPGYQKWGKYKIANKLGCIDSRVLKANLLSVKSKVVNKQHETQKPVELMETLINLVSHEGQTILDLFMAER